MYVTVAKGGCIGCGACVDLLPEVFHWGTDGRAEAKNDPVSEDAREAVLKAARMCPKDVIFIEEEG